MEQEVKNCLGKKLE